MNREEVFYYLLDLRDETRDLIEKNENDDLLKSFEKELNRYIGLIKNEWPLPPKIRETVDLGRVAVREYNDVYPGYVTRISKICAALRNE